jgi:hypothetical protein
MGCDNSSTLKMEMVYSSEYLIPVSQATQHHIPEEVLGIFIAIKEKCD